MSTVSRETDALLKYAALVRKWNPAINLVAPSTLADFEQRHIEDCRQVVELSAGASGSWLDIGSGGGLPGLVIAIERPDLAITLIESDQRKASFLRNAVRELGLQNTRIIADRIENVPRLDVANVSARALAPLRLLMAYVETHLAPTGRAWLMKGRNWQAEVQKANAEWTFEHKTHPSRTDPDAAILEISGIHHV